MIYVIVLKITTCVLCGVKRLFSKTLTVCCCILSGILVNCSQEEALPSLVISDLSLDNQQVIISTSPTFDITGSLTFNGAQLGIKSLRVTSVLGMDLTVPVTGVQMESGRLIGIFTLQMITTPGVVPFTLWVIDGTGRSSNKLDSSFEMIADSYNRQTPVVLKSVTWDKASKSHRLEWTKNSDADFYAYIITRHRPDDEESSEVTRILDQQVTTAFDAGNHAVGFNYSYSVLVSNQKSTVESNRMEGTYPYATQLSTPLKPMNRPILSSSGDRMYFINDEAYLAHTPTLKAISTQSNSEVRSFDLKIVSPYMPLALSRDDSKLYIVFEDSLIMFDASSFTVLNTVHLNFFASEITCGRANRLYAVPYAPASSKGQIKILDATTGAVIGDLGIPDVQMKSCVISPDGNTLYGVGQPMDKGFAVGLLNIYKIDISTDMAKVLNTRTASNQAAIEMSSDGQKLYVSQHFYPSTNTVIDVWSASALQSIDQFTLSYMQDYLITDASIVTFTHDSYPSANYYYKLALVDLSTNSLLNSWDYFSGWTGDHYFMLMFSRDNKSLYLFDEHSKCWVISLPS
jgi:hypothetical protein